MNLTKEQVQELEYEMNNHGIKHDDSWEDVIARTFYEIGLNSKYKNN